MGAKSTSAFDLELTSRNLQDGSHIGLKGGHHNTQRIAYKKSYGFTLSPYVSSLLFASYDLKRMSESYVLLEIGNQPYLTTFQDLDGRLAFSM